MVNHSQGAEGQQNELVQLLKAVPEARHDSLMVYVRLLQLELWLRQMVYTEFVAAHGAGQSTKLEKGRPALEADSRLTHMASPEQHLLSYISFTSLCEIVNEEWNLFKPYLPPQDLWRAKIEELKQIRNRVAHFRSPHRDDYGRVRQLLRDLDQGFWLFCTSYNNSRPILPPASDPVTTEFAHLDQLGYAKVQGGWARVGIRDPGAVVSVTIEVGVRRWATTPPNGPYAGVPGCIYDLNVHTLGPRYFDYPQFLKTSEKLHPQLMHIILDALSQVLRITLPASLGEQTVVGTIRAILRHLEYTLRQRHEPQSDPEGIQALADQWPEYVIGPKNPLAYLDPGMPCSFFSV